MIRTFDLRSLAVFRMGLGLLIILDLFTRAGFLVEHYTDDGLLPRYALLQKFWRPAYWSLHVINGEAWFQIALFGVIGLCAFFVLVGYRTRLFLVISWLLAISLQNRISIILSGGDMLLRALMLFAIFLPVGARWSLDHHQNPDRANAAQSTSSFEVKSWAGVCLMLQLAFVYHFVIYIRTGGPHWWDGTALYYAFSIDQMTTDWGMWLKSQTEILTLATHATLYVELLGPLLIFVPIFTRKIRLVVVFVMCGLHLSIPLFMKIGHFPLISCVGWLFLLPADFWNFSAVQKVSHQVGGWIAQRVFWRALLKLPPSQKSPYPSPVLEGIAVLLIVYIFAWNMRATKAPYFNLPYQMNLPGRLLRLDQHWNLFAPYPVKNDGWFVMVGQLKSGKEINLWDPEKPISYDKPAKVSDMYRGHRHQKYMMNMWTKNFKNYRLYFGKHTCRKWNRLQRHKDKLETFQLYYMQERTLPVGEKEPEKLTVWRHSCYKKDPND